MGKQKKSREEELAEEMELIERMLRLERRIVGIGGACIMTFIAHEFDMVYEHVAAYTTFTLIPLQLYFCAQWVKCYLDLDLGE